MSLVKSLYLDEVEERWSRLVDEGLDPDHAYDVASHEAFHALGDRMADLADRARDEWKERDR